jgi:signal transduction histidine kinase
VNVAQVIAITATSAAMVLCVISLGAWRAPNWKDLRWFAPIAGFAGLFALCDVTTTSSQASDEAVLWAWRLSLSLTALHCLAWVGYVNSLANGGWTRAFRVFLPILLATAVLALVPGLAYQGPVTTRHLAWLGLTYRDVTSTSFGGLLSLFPAVGLLVPLAHFTRALRAGEPRAAAHLMALGALTAATVNDMLSWGRVIDTPYLLDAGVLIVIVSLGWSVVRRFVSDAHRLEEISTRLEQAVEGRTRDLMVAQAALTRSEKLAAVGRLSAGVAHEINNPAAVVTANLGYLVDSLDDTGRLPDDFRACLEESQVSIRRVAQIVRQLLDAGRVAGGAPISARPFRVARVVRDAVECARVSVPESVRILIDVPSDLRALGEALLFEQVLTNLIVNAGQAIAETKRPGQIEVTATWKGERVSLVVADDGPGIDERVLDQVFEPFFTTRALGKGTGLGLAVSLGLVRALGGDLRILSTSPQGTKMGIELPWAPPAQVEMQDTPTPIPKHRRRLLLVDDEVKVLHALRRALSAHFLIEVCEGVEPALARIRKAPSEFDVVLCDLMMPDGGGMRFFDELQKLAPGLAARTLFMTGGATTDETQRFVQARGRFALDKPLDLAALRGLVEELFSPPGATGTS